MQRLLSAAVITLLAAAGCGTTSQGNQRAATAPVGTDTENVECHDEQVLGSTIPRRVCRDKATQDRDRQGAQDWSSKPAANPTNVR